ncbi:MAG: TraB/GumN family protein, partial [Rhizobiaceae bacterium]|nr:TraB/GumN family protein [Rhizobiaceae bacterium]
MSRALAIADRAALISLKALVVANFLFLLSFLFVATLAIGQARAEAPACAGHDMLAELGSSDPAVLAKIESEAAATPNGKGLLWKIEKAGTAPSYLLGTMHMTDPRVTSLPPTAQAAFDKSQTVVIETTEILDQSKMMA